MRLLILALATLLALSGCHKTSPPGEAPTGVTVTPGDGLVVVSWDTLPDLTYWIFFQPGSTVAVATPESFAIRRAFSPRVVGPLANGTQYAFVVNATHNDSAAGPNSAPFPATPALAGGTWTSGAALGPPPPQNLKSLVFFGGRFVTVGDAASIFAGDFNYTNVTPPGVTAWTPPATLPTGFTSNLSAVTSSVVSNGSPAFVALGADGSIISSADGLNWFLNNPVPATGMNDLAFGFVSGSVPTYVAVGDGGKIFVTTDLVLVPWTQVMSQTPNDLKSVSLLNGFFVATGAGGTLLTSIDGRNWNVETIQNVNPSNTLRGATFSAFNSSIHYVVVGDAGTVVTSSDMSPVGANWIAITAPGAPNLQSVTPGGAAGSRFLAVGQGGAVVYSDDGQAWVTASSGSFNLAKVLFVSGMYLAVGDGGANAVSR